MSRIKVSTNKITPRFGFGWTWYWNGELLVVHFDFYKRTAAIHLDFRRDAMGDFRGN